MAAPTENGDAGVLVSEEAEQKQLLRAMANKMYEEERARRIKEEQEVDDDLVKKRALESLVRVQEDIVRAVNVMKVSLASWLIDVAEGPCAACLGCVCSCR